MGDKTVREERRGRTSSQIKDMIEERHELFALLLQLSNFHSNDSHPPKLHLLAEFCQVLVDYIAAGHFGLYHRVADGTERRRHVAGLATQVFPRISETTRTAVAFNEKYSVEHEQINLRSFQNDLSRLGEALTTRIELEDRLIEQLLDGGAARGR